MKTLLLTAVAAALLASQARAAEPELSIDAKRMLSYGTLAVMTGACKTTLTPDQAARIKAGLAHSSEAQKELPQDAFTEAMKAVGTQVGQNKDQVCAGLPPEFIETSLTDAAEGR